MPSQKCLWKSFVRFECLQMPQDCNLVISFAVFLSLGYLFLKLRVCVCAQLKEFQRKGVMEKVFVVFLSQYFVAFLV